MTLPLYLRKALETGEPTGQPTFDNFISRARTQRSVDVSWLPHAGNAGRHYGLVLYAGESSLTIDVAEMGPTELYDGKRFRLRAIEVAEGFTRKGIIATVHGEGLEDAVRRFNGVLRR